MTQFRNSYDCPCGNHWEDDWSCMCDDRCPACDTSCSPTSSVKLMGESPVLTFTKDFAKMEDMMAKIYQTHGKSQKSNQITLLGQMMSRNKPWKEAFEEYEMRKPVLSDPSMLPSMRDAAKSQLFHELYGKSVKMTILDDGLWFPRIPKPEEGIPYDPMDFYEDGDRLVYGTFRFPSTEKDWERTRFVAGGETPPNAKKRAKLKAKRKKR